MVIWALIELILKPMFNQTHNEADNSSYSANISSPSTNWQIRFAAAKLLSAYERLKAMYYLEGKDEEFIAIFNKISDKLKVDLFLYLKKL